MKPEVSWPRARCSLKKWWIGWCQITGPGIDLELKDFIGPRVWDKKIFALGIRYHCVGIGIGLDRLDWVLGKRTVFMDTVYIDLPGLVVRAE